MDVKEKELTERSIVRFRERIKWILENEPTSSSRSEIIDIYRDIIRELEALLKES